jgi:CFEM domain
LIVRGCPFLEFLAALGVGLGIFRLVDSAPMQFESAPSIRCQALIESSSFHHRQWRFKTLRDYSWSFRDLSLMPGAEAEQEGHNVKQFSRVSWRCLVFSLVLIVAMIKMKAYHIVGALFTLTLTLSKAQTASAPVSEIGSLAICGVCRSCRKSVADVKQQTCVTSAISHFGCGIGDFSCLCVQPNLLSIVAQCAQQECDQQNQKNMNDTMPSVCSRQQAAPTTSSHASPPKITDPSTMHHISIQQ